MFIRLLSTQIADYWEIIKFTLASVDDFEKEDMPSHLNQMLHDLLSDKAQCFFKLEPETREIMTVFITRIDTNKLSKKKFFHVHSIYSFKTMSNKEWIELREIFVGFGRKNGCYRMTFRSKNPRAWELGRLLEFKEDYRAFVIDL